MGRSRLSDVLQSHLFWAFDASNSGVPVFNPLFGFSRISAPEISSEIETFKDGTFVFNRSVIKGGSVGTVTFERAASMFDSDFYSWIMFALQGNKDFEDAGTLGKVANFLTSGGRSSPRRNLLIVQFTNINLSNLKASDDPMIATAQAAGLAILGAIATNSLGGALGSAALGGAVSVGIGPFQFAKRIPARAWVLQNCLPVRYKSGSDFDASSANVSLQELEVAPESIEELSLGLKP